MLIYISILSSATRRMETASGHFPRPGFYHMHDEIGYPGFSCGKDWIALSLQSDYSAGTGIIHDATGAVHVCMTP